MWRIILRVLIPLFVGIPLMVYGIIQAYRIHDRAHGESGSQRAAEACLVIQSNYRGYRYLEPERGHCWPCDQAAPAQLSDSARRVCGLPPERAQ